MSSTALAAPYVRPEPAPEPEPMAWRAAPLPPPNAGTRSYTARASHSRAAGVAQTNVFFLNYDGVTLQWTGDDDATQDQTAFEEFAATYKPYGDGNKRAASLQAVKADWAKYDVEVTDERPEQGEYTMSVNSPTNVIGPGVLGVAMLDCEDKHAASNIVLAFHSAEDKFSASTQATTMSQEIAHAYGLEHVNEPEDIMNPYNAGGDPSFRDECLKLDPNAKVLCGAQHQQFCEGGRQNSHAELTWLFGGSEPDAVPPTVSITSPKDGDQFEAPAEVTIVAEAADNVGVSRVDLFIDGANQNAPRATPPFEWKGAKFPAGHYCVTVEASDSEPNKVMSAPVCFTVTRAGEGPGGGGTTGDDGGESGGEPSETGGGGESGGEPGSGGDPGGESGGAGTEGEPEPSGSSSGEGAGDEGGWPPDSGGAFPPAYGMSDEEGCGCAQGQGPGASGLLLLIGLAGVGRRRRQETGSR